MAVDQRRIEHIPLDDITSAARNPKRHDLAAVRASIERFGFASPALRDERTGRLVVGHGRIEALRQLRDQGASPPSGVHQDDQGRWLVPVVCGWSSRSDIEAEAYLVADNRHTELGGWDQELLLQSLEAVSDMDPDLLDAIGYDTATVEDMTRALEPPDLDELAKMVGEPSEDDGWSMLRLKVPPHVSAAWQAHLDTHHGDVPAAMADLLDVPVDPVEGVG